MKTMAWSGTGVVGKSTLPPSPIRVEVLEVVVGATDRDGRWRVRRRAG